MCYKKKNIYSLQHILDINMHLIYYQYVYSFHEDNSINKDLCIISNYRRNHYFLLFAKNHKG